MNKRGLAPVDVRKQLFDMVTLVFSGLHEETGELRAGSGTSKLPEDAIYKTIYQLSQEFPDCFPHYFVEMLNGIPYCGTLEDILFNYGAFGIVKHGSDKHTHLIMINDEMKKVIAMVLRQYHSEEKLRKLLPLVRRFDDLMNRHVKP